MSDGHPLWLPIYTSHTVRPALLPGLILSFPFLSIKPLHHHTNLTIVLQYLELMPPEGGNPGGLYPHNPNAWSSWLFLLSPRLLLCTWVSLTWLWPMPQVPLPSVVHGLCSQVLPPRAQSAAPLQPYPKISALNALLKSMELINLEVMEKYTFSAILTNANYFAFLSILLHFVGHFTAAHSFMVPIFPITTFCVKVLSDNECIVFKRLVWMQSHFSKQGL